MPDFALQAINIHKSYREGNHSLAILKGANLAVAKGERLAIMGVSGAGKSTLLHLLGGLEQLDSGEIYVASEVMHTLDASASAQLRNRHLGFVYQFHHLLAEFTAAENVAIPLLLRKVARTEALQQAMEFLALLGMDNRASHRPSQLSGGERQRVAIARALVTRPACVLMDEPTGNLDLGTAAQIQALLLRLSYELKIALVIATHNTTLAASMDSVLQLAHGLLQPDGAKK